jgi:anaerobic selenocysteine-containing dehydrogenase
VLPSAANPEREGTYTNLERRLQKIEPLIPPPGSAQEPWTALAALARALGEDFGWTSIADVWRDIRREVSTHSDVDLNALAQPSPPTSLQYESGFEVNEIGDAVVAGPGAGYPKGYRSGAPFQTGQNWPLSWELRAFEAKQRPGVIPAVGNGGAAPDATLPGVQPPAIPAGRYVLYTGRLIYDTGTMVSKSTFLRELQKRPFVEMNDEDVKELGAADGDEVIVAADGTEVRCTVTVGDIARGAVFIPYAQDGFAVNSFIHGIDPTVEVKTP